jgi:hypothetical protein
MDDLLVWIPAVNQILTAGIAITAFSLFLYSLTFNLRDRVARSFAIILLCVVVVSTTEALQSRSISNGGIDTLLRGSADGAMDVVNIKISKFGGLTKARQARDLCVSLGIGMTIEDSWGGDIVTAAIAHLAHSTPPEVLFTSTDFNSYVTVSTAEGAPQRVNGRMAASTKPGLGITPRMDVLGKPVLDIHD